MAIDRMLNVVTDSFAPSGKFQPAALFLPPLREKWAKERAIEERAIEEASAFRQLTVLEHIQGTADEAAQLTDPSRKKAARRLIRKQADVAGLEPGLGRSIVRSAGLGKGQLRQAEEKQAGATAAAGKAGVDPALLGGITDSGQLGQTYATIAQGQAGAKRAREAASFEHGLALNEIGVRAGVAKKAADYQHNLDLDEIRVRTQAERDTQVLAPTDAEKRVAAYKRAIRSLNPLDIQATLGALDDIGDDSGTVLMHDPTSGLLVSGTGKAAKNAITTATRSKLETNRENGRHFLSVSKRLLDIAGPDTLGLRGRMKGTLQDLSATGRDGEAMVADMQALAKALGPFADESAQAALEGVYDPNIPASQALLLATAAAIAHQNNPDGRISDFDMETAMKQVGADDWLANPLRLRSALTALTETSRVEIRRATRALRATEREAVSPITAAAQGEAMKFVRDLTPEEMMQLSPDQRKAVADELKRQAGLSAND